MTKPTCKACNKNYNVLTKERLCAYCFQDEKKFWSLEFSDYTKDEKGNLISRDGPMKFRKVKVRSKKKKKKRK